MRDTLRYPDFYIVGAPKCGTTALHHYLSQSDFIVMLRKEIHYFGKDLNFNRPRVSHKQYLQECEAIRPTHLIGDASVYYLRSHTAAEEIYACNPRAKIIICLRNPVDFMHSLHAQLIATADEIEKDFETALSLETRRVKGQKIPWHTHPVHALCYREMASFNQQVARFYKVFPSRNISIVLLDEIASDARKVCHRLFDFLGLPVPNSLDLKVVNATTTVRLKYLKILHKTYFSSDAKVRKVLPRILVRSIDYICFGLMSKRVIKDSIDPQLRARLVAEFSNEIEQLSTLIDCDLSRWKC